MVRCVHNVVLGNQLKKKIANFWYELFLPRDIFINFKQTLLVNIYIKIQNKVF